MSTCFRHDCQPARKASQYFITKLPIIIIASRKLHVREAWLSMRDAVMQVSVKLGPNLDISGPNHLK